MANAERNVAIVGAGLIGRAWARDLRPRRLERPIERSACRDA